MAGSVSLPGQRTQRKGVAIGAEGMDEGVFSLTKNPPKMRDVMFLACSGVLFITTN